MINNFVPVVHYYTCPGGLLLTLCDVVIANLINSLKLPGFYCTGCHFNFMRVGQAFLWGCHTCCSLPFSCRGPLIVWIIF